MSLLALSHPNGKGPIDIDDGGDDAPYTQGVRAGTGRLDRHRIESHEEQCIKDLLRKVHSESPNFWHQVVEDCRGIRGNNNWVHRLQQMVAGGSLLFPGDQRFCN